MRGTHLITFSSIDRKGGNAFPLQVISWWRSDSHLQYRLCMFACGFQSIDKRPASCSERKML
jgi:hypothetical protein